MGELIIHECIHIIVALIFGLLVFWKTKSKSRALILVILSLLIDLDHLYDYLLWSKGSFSLHEVLKVQYFRETGKAYVVFHAWEWLIVLGLFSIWRGWKSIFVILFFALLSQLIVDSFTVGSFSFYSIIVRYLNDFALLV